MQSTYPQAEHNLRATCIARLIVYAQTYSSFDRLRFVVNTANPQDCTAHGRRSPINYHMHPAGVTAFPAFDALSIDFLYFFVPTFASRSAWDRPIGA